VKALTVRQPMAWAIAAGYKREENRSRGTSHRGALAIHAGKWDRDYARIVKELLVDKGVLSSVDEAVSVRRDLLVTHAIVAVTDLHAVCRIGDSARCRCSGWVGIGVHHWRLRDTQPLPEPVTDVKGALGLWEIDLKGVA
jgi:hypothetical protein